MAIKLPKDLDSFIHQPDEELMMKKENKRPGWRKRTFSFNEETLSRLQMLLLKMNRGTFERKYLYDLIEEALCDFLKKKEQ